MRARTVMRLLLLGVLAPAIALLASADAQTLLLTLDTPNPQASAHFGNSVAVGDVNGDGKADIAVGVLAESVGTNTEQGRTYVFSGSGTASGASVSGGRGSSAPSAAVLAGIAAGGALLLLAAGGWYARRRWRTG